MGVERELKEIESDVIGLECELKEIEYELNEIE